MGGRRMTGGWRRGWAVLGMCMLCALAEGYDYPVCPHLCDDTYHKQCPGGIILGAGGHFVALNISLALKDHEMWDIRVMQTDDPTDKSDHAQFYVMLLDEVNYALYRAGKEYRACEESNVLNTPTNCLSFQSRVCKQHVYEEGGVQKSSNYTHIVVECTSDHLTCPIRYKIGFAPDFPPPPCMVGAVSCWGFVGILFLALVGAAGFAYVFVLVMQHKRSNECISLEMMGGNQDTEGKGGPMDFGKEIDAPYARL